MIYWHIFNLQTIDRTVMEAFTITILTGITTLRTEIKVKNKSNKYNQNIVFIIVGCFSKICSNSSIQNAEINYSSHKRAKSAGIQASTMQKQIIPGPGKQNLLEFKLLQCRNKYLKAKSARIQASSRMQK